MDTTTMLLFIAAAALFLAYIGTVAAVVSAWVAIQEWHASLHDVRQDLPGSPLVGG